MQMGKDLANGKKMILSVYSRYPKNIDLHASKQSRGLSKFPLLLLFASIWG